MRVFELHFNPKRREDRIFDSFVYEPESQEEGHLGSLCVAGELNQAMPQSKDFIENLAGLIKNNFYEKMDFAGALKVANDFLDKETKSGNVSWLGNLNFAAINVQNSILNFTKVGNIKILLLREGEVLDISQNLELQDVEPYPMKVFSNTASGKLSSEDKILILTKDIFSIISRDEDFLNQLSRAANEKELKRIFQPQRSAISEISGILLLITQQRESTPIGINIPKIKLPGRAILIFILISVLAAAFFIFKGERGEKEEKLLQYQIELNEARSKIIMAENLLIMKKNEKAQVLFREAWNMLQPIQIKEATSLRESIEKYLK